MTSKINLINNALRLIGDNEIESLVDPGFGAQLANAVYEDTYNALLAEHPWSFAFKEQYLSQLSQAPDTETGYNYAYQLPVDMIRIWQIFDHSDYVIVGDKLYSNQTKILMRYIFSVAESQLPPHFAKAMEYKLAAEFAVPVTDNDNYASLYETKYLQQVAKAMAIDSQNRPQVAIVDAPFVDARNSGVGFYSYTGGS